ncbi:MAG: ribbon-helix-helix domain-containing protein, partial [Polyangiales bacterium]
MQERKAKNRTFQENAQKHRFTPASSTKMQGLSLRQGGVLFNKTASAARDVFDVHAPHRMTCSTPSAYSQVRGEIRARQASRAAYYLLVRGLRHFIGVRVGDEHVARLDALAKASGFTRGEILRRALLNADIPSSRTRQE